MRCVFGTEVVREVLLDVRELPIERDEQVDEPRRREPGAVSSPALGLRLRVPASRKCSAHVHDIARKPISSMLAQLIPTSGGFAASQLSSWSTIAARVSRRRRSATTRGRAAASADDD